MLLVKVHNYVAAMSIQSPIFGNDENRATCANGYKSACRGLLWYVIIEILPLHNTPLTLSAYVLSRHQILALVC